MIRISTIGTADDHTDDTGETTDVDNSDDLGQLDGTFDDTPDEEPAGEPISSNASELPPAAFDADAQADRDTAAFDAAVVTAKDSFVLWANRVADLQAELKDAKTAMKEAHEHLLDLERGGVDRFARQRRLLGGSGSSDSTAGTDGGDDAGTTDEATAAAQATPISDLPGLSAGLVKILREENGIATIADLAAWTAGGRKLVDLKKMGPKKAEQLEEAWLAFCGQHSEA